MRIGIALKWAGAGSTYGRFGYPDYASFRVEGVGNPRRLVVSF